ncbi:spore coat protein CotH [Pedobacter sp. UYP24]
MDSQIFKDMINKGYNLCCILLVFSVCVSCKKDKKEPIIPEPVVLKTDKQLKTLLFKASKNPILVNDVRGEIVGDTVFASAFAGTDVSALIPEFTYEGSKIVVGAVDQVTNVTVNDFTKLVTYEVTAEDNSTKKYVVKLSDNGISAFYINTNGAAINSKDVYVTGSIKIVSNFKETVFDGKTEIKGRGNSTWGMPKKPYRIKLDKKAGLLGMSESKNWVLLANYADKSLMRNELALMASRNSGLTFTPSSRFVEIYLNGSYDGNYLITEQVKEGKSQVDVEDGGYLLEEDGFANGEPVYFRTQHNMPITIKYPDEKITPVQKEYITGHVQKFENALFAANFTDPVNGYRKYFDVDSYVNYYIVNEVMGNPDTFWSTYMYKKANDDKIYTGPVWDFDICANNDDRLGNNINKLMFNAGFDPKMWIQRLMEDPAFRKRIRFRWNELKPKMQNLPAAVTLLEKKLSVSQVRNFTRWNILNTKVYREVQIAGSYAAEVSYVKDFLTGHLNWLDTKFNGTEYQ